MAGAVEQVGPIQLLPEVATKAAVIRHRFYPRGTRLEQRGLRRPVVYFCVGGPVREIGHDAPLTERRLLYLPPGFEGAFQYEGNAHVLTMEIVAPPARSKERGPSRGAAIPLVATLSERMWEILIRLAEEKPAPRPGRSVERFLAACRAQIENPPPIWLSDLVDRLHAQWRSPPHLREIARASGKSRQHVCRAFKERMGTTVRRYSLLIRLDYASGLIWCTQMPLSEIANAAGFTDQSHLTRALGEVHAITPARLRMSAPCLHQKRFQVDDLLE